MNWLKNAFNATIAWFIVAGQWCADSWQYLKTVNWMDLYNKIQQFSSKLFVASGVPVIAHWSIWLVMLYVLLFLPHYFVFFGVGVLSLIAHEFGHVWMAEKQGIGCRKIILLPVGGLTIMNEMPKEPKKEIFIAGAGLAVSVILTLLFLVPGLIFAGTAMEFMWFNLFMVLFNILPIFPMDGGRILRAVIAMKYEYLTATKTVMWFSHGFCALLLIYGLFTLSSPIILTVAFLYLLTDIELRLTEHFLKMIKKEAEIAAIKEAAEVKKEAVAVPALANQA